MNETHTPLPWEVIGHGFELRIVDANATSICEGFFWNDQGRANAELIVRACNSYHDLLRACKKIDAAKTEREVDAALELVEAAIAKAKQRQP